MIVGEIEVLQISDIEELVSNQVEESRTLDYKQQLPGESGDDRREFLYDVAAFANAEGGDIVFGISDKRDDSGKSTGLPDTICGIQVHNESDLASRLGNMIRDGIHPRLHVWTRFMSTDSWTVLVLRVPKSLSAPHMVTFQKVNKFYTRSNTDKELMSLEQIRSSFLTGQILEENLANWRGQRFDLIESGRPPIQLISGAALVVHAISGDFFSRRRTLQSWNLPADLRSGIELPNERSGSYSFYNADGLLLHSYIYRPSPSREEAGVKTYAQVFRAGAVEYVDTSISFTFQNDPESKKLALCSVERSLWSCFTNIKSNREALQLHDPIFFGAALVNITNHTVYLGPYRDVHFEQPIVGSRVTVPEFRIELPTDDVAAALRPVADFFAQAAGLEKTPFVERDGRWNPFMER